MPPKARRGVAIALGNFAIFKAIEPGFVAGCADAPPLAKISDGTRVVFTAAHDIFPECVVPEGTTAAVTENGLNEIACACIVTPDDPALRTALAQWEGNIWLTPPSVAITMALRHCRVEISIGARVSATSKSTNRLR